MGLPTNDSLLAPGQKLTETWEVEFEGQESRTQKPYRWVEARLRHWYHNTYYGGSHGSGQSIAEARLAMVLATARAICADDTAFQHDADDIFRGEMLRWFQGKLKELDEELTEEREGELPRKSMIKRIKRKVKLVEQLCAEWQEDYDYWPEEKDDAPGSETAREKDTRRARLADLRDKAAAARTNAG